MGVQHLLQPFLVLLTAHGIGAFVYSCEEAKYKILNTSFTQATDYACIVTKEGFSNWDQLEKVYAQVGMYYTSFHDIATSKTSCIENMRLESPWTFFADAGVSLDCSQEFTLILSSELPEFVAPRKEEERYLLEGGSRVLVVPQTGMWIHKRRCVGDGNVTVFTGAGKGEQEEQFVMKSWSCATLPDWTFSFDSVLTIDVDDSTALTVECSSLLEMDAMIMATPGDRLVVLSSGRSDDLQNLQGTDHTAFVLIGEWETHDVTVDMQLTFDPSNTGSVILEKGWDGPESNYYTGTHSEQFATNFFEVRYAPSGKHPSQIGTSQDNIVIEIVIDSKAPSTEPTSPPPTPSSQAYCSCSISDNGSPLGWKYSEIWLDVVVIIDTSEAMGEQLLNEAAVLTESLLRSRSGDALETDSTATFYTRLGVIAMAETAEVVYNLNMTKSGIVQGKLSVKKGLAEINVVDAFEAARTMLSDGLASNPESKVARQVIYFMTNSEMKYKASSIDQFKASGVIMINNFLQPGQLELPGLKDLASPGYFFTNNQDSTMSLQAFCKANCFCHSDKTPYTGQDPAFQASGGCYLSYPDARLPFNKAQSACSTQGGFIATDHDEQKGAFLKNAVNSSKSDYFWIGYARSDDGVWQWDDQSTSTYTNWGAGEPSDAAVAKCAYVDKSNTMLPWGAGNCQMGLPYVCEYTPCAVGNNKC